MARRNHERGHEAWALRLLGEIAAHAEPPHVPTAEAHYREYQRIRRGEARAELATAAELYRPMGMTFWLAKAEAALAQIAG